MLRSANPALRPNVFKKAGYVSSGAMSIQGVVNKTGFLLLLAVFSASWVWAKYGLQNLGGYITLGAIAGFITALVTIFKKEWAYITAPLYALFEGLFLGGISAVFEARYPGIVIQAVSLTFGVMFAMLFAYKSKIIKPTENFKLGLFAATGGIVLVYFLSIVLGFFGLHIPFIFSSGPLGIGFSIFVVIIAALNLVMDFDFIEEGSRLGAPKYMEWYASFGLMVTLIWLYIEILRLLAKLQERR